MTNTGGRIRLGIAAGLGALATVLIAAPASAHVEVEADKDQAGARDVTLTFTGEAESVTGGIASERIVLPAGITPGEVTLVKAPKGWKYSPAADGFTVAGTALKVGKDAVFAVKVAQLPTDATTLSFKTLETYSDGKISRWIELPQEGEAEPDNPAPTLKLKAAAKTATPSAAATSTATPSAAATSAAPSTPVTSDAPSPAPVAEAATKDSGNSSVVWWIVAAVVAIIAAGAGLLRRRRQDSAGQ